MLAGQGEEPRVDDRLAVDGDEDRPTTSLATRPDQRVEEARGQLLLGGAWPTLISSWSILDLPLWLLPPPNVLFRIFSRTDHSLTETFSTSQLDKVLHPWTSSCVNDMGPVPSRPSGQFSVALDKEDTGIANFITSSLLFALCVSRGRGDSEAGLKVQLVLC